MLNEPWTRDQNPRYLGDGVYAWDEGYYIWIGTQRDNGWETIALDTNTFQALINYKTDREALRVQSNKP